MKCPKCKHEWTASGAEIASELGRRSSAAKTKAARENAKLGGWPKGKKRKTTTHHTPHEKVKKPKRERIPPRQKVK